MTSILIDTIIKYWGLGQAKRTPSGWFSANAVCCSHNGESPDTRRRGGINSGFDGTLTYHCFNCGFRASWRPGLALSNKMKRLLRWMGAPDDEIKRVNFEIFKFNKEVFDPSKQTEEVPYYADINFKEHNLPSGAETLDYWLKQGTTDKNFVDVLTYVIEGRGEEVFENYTFYWTPDEKTSLTRSVIIPFYYNNILVGWNARRIDPGPSRYYGDIPNNFIFNNQLLFNKEKHIILVEGLFDAIAVNGVSPLGSKVNDVQLRWLKTSGKEIIVVPDRDKAGAKILDVALQNNWYVSFPRVWENDIYDCADAVKRYGSTFVIKTVIDSMSKDPLRINLTRKTVCR